MYALRSLSGISIDMRRSGVTHCADRVEARLSVRRMPQRNEAV